MLKKVYKKEIKSMKSTSLRKMYLL